MTIEGIPPKILMVTENLFRHTVSSTFHKQDNNSAQKVGYASTRIEKILNKEYSEGKIMSPQYK